MTQLGVWARELASAFEEQDGELRLPAERVAKALEQIVELRPEDREEVAAELLALGMKLQRTSKLPVNGAVEQLCTVAAALLKGSVDRSELVGSAGTMSKWTGQAEKLRAPAFGVSAPLGTIKAHAHVASRPMSRRSKV